MSSSPRQTTDPSPLPASPAKTGTLAPATGGDAAATSGIPFAGQAGIAAADADAGDRRQTAAARPASSSTSGSGERDSAPSDHSPAGGASPPQAPPPHADGQPGREDGPLESIGKAVSSPITGAAEDEEPK